MKYTSEEAKKANLKEPKFIPKVEIKDGFYIVESKMNYL